MRIKSFAIMFLCVLSLCSGLMLAGCGDKYSSLAIDVDKTEISLKIGSDTDEEGISSSALLTATLKGASAEMTRGMSFRFEDTSIVTSSVINNSGDVNTIQLTASTAGVTKMYIVSNEYGGVESQPITVTVYRDAETITFDDSKRPSVKLGDSLSLISNDLLKFAVNGETVKIYPNEATFSLMTPDDARWNKAYGSVVPEGVSVVDNVLYTTKDTKCGIVQLVASLGNLDTVVYVMVYKDIDANAEISLYQNETEVTDAIKSIINPIEENGNRMQLRPEISDESQTYSLSIKSQNSDILLVSSPNASNQINASVLNSGKTKVDVMANVIDPVTQNVYVTFTKTYDVQISRIVNSILVSSDDVARTDEPAKMTVQDLYIGDVYGKRVHFNVSPNNNDNSGPVVNTDVVLSVVQIDGEDYQQTDDFDDVVVWVNDHKYTWGSPISDDSDIYVRLGSTSIVNNNFRLKLSANTYDSSLPEASNYIDFDVEVGVRSIHPSLYDAVMGVGMTTDFDITYTDSNNKYGNGSPKFTFSSSEYYSITDNGNYNYTLTALKEGDANITITAESGASAVITLKVRTVLSAMGITLPKDKSVVSVTNATTDESQTVQNTGVEAFTIALNGTIDLGYTVNPSSIGSQSFVITSVNVSDTGANCISVAKSFVNGKLRLNAIGVTEQDSLVAVTIGFTYYKVNESLEGNRVESAQGERTVYVSVYKPIDYMYWENTNNSDRISQYILNSSNLNYIDNKNGKSSATLRIKYDNTATYFLYGNKIKWESDDIHRVSIVESETEGEVTVTATLDKTDTAKYYTVNITAYVNDYGRTYLLTCVVTIENPVKVNSIELLNYYDEYYGIRLNDLGTSNRTQYQILPEVAPSNAYNQKLNYVILNEDRTAIVEDDKAIITLDETNPNIIKAVKGKSGVCWVRIYPQDALITKDMTYKDVSLYKDVRVVVENGENNAYSIYEPAEFLAIGDSSVSMTKNYILMNSIDLSAYSESYFPLCKSTAFSGTLSTAYDKQFTIGGLPVVNNVGVAESTGYLGVFSQIINTGTKPAIKNINFYFERGSVDLSGLNSKDSKVNVSTIYAGLLAGRIEGSLSNVFVSYANYRTNSISITNMPSEVQNFYYGAVAGELVGGNAEYVYANLSLNLVNMPSSTSLAVGGVFGRFAGISFGQDDSLVCNVKITATTTVTDTNAVNNKIKNVGDGQVITEGIGGLIGIASQYTSTDNVLKSGVVRSMQAMGTISAPTLVNVGGLVGLNYITLGDDNGGSTLYKNLASVRVNGGANVGGFVGTNLGSINYGISEMYDTVSDATADDLIWVKGLYNVGGFAGNSIDSALIMYSYAMSYVNRTMVQYGADTSGKDADDKKQYYGDIVGVANTGGFVGLNSAIILNSFAYTQIQQIDSDNDTINALGKYTGGFAGSIVFSVSNKHIDYSYAIGTILASSSTTNAVLGEYVGYYDASTDNLINQSYASVDISLNNGDGTSQKIYNFVGTNKDNSKVSQCFYMVADGDSSQESDGGYEFNKMDLSKNTGSDIYRTATWGFSELGNISPQQWVVWDADKVGGMNKNLPILFDKNAKMLYSQMITQIKAEPKDYTQESANLPTYFGYRDLNNNILGSVVLLDNIALDNNNKRSIAIKDLLNITVAPSMDASEWKISLESSDYRIMEVVQPKQNLIDSSLIFKECGVVTLTLRSLLNIDVYCTIEINVVGGFDEFTLTDGKGRNMIDDNYIMYVKVGNEQEGYSIHPEFAQKQENVEYITKKGLVYSTSDTDCISFAGTSFEGVQAFIDSSKATIISGLKAKEDNIVIGVTPYIELNFGGNTYRNVFSNLSKSFKVKVYQGISSVDIYTGIKSNMSSGSEVYISVNVVTDNTEIVNIKDFVLKKDGVEVDEDDISRYAELISESKDIKIATDNNFTCYRDNQIIENKLTVAQIVLDLIDGKEINAYIEIDGVKYSSSADILSLKDFLITNCVSYTYMLSLKGEDRVIRQNVVFDLSYVIEDIECGDTFSESDQITFIPASVNKMDLHHYTYGAESMEAGEAAGNSISPGTNGILRIDVLPYYSYFDYVGISSTALDNTGSLMMQQLIYTKGVYKYITQNAEYDSKGSLILRKITGIDSNGQEYFDGKIYVSTLITAGTPEGSRYRISAEPVRQNGNNLISLIEQQDIMLTTTFAPYATLKLDSDYSSNIVARGTVANLRLSGTLLNSRLTLSASYYGTENGSRLTNCAFDTSDIKYVYSTGEKEDVNMVIPFYVGLLAKPDNGKITISVTINSWTSLGGQLNPLIILCTLNIVDYIPNSAFTNGTQTGNFEISINTYTSLNARLSLPSITINDFVNFIGYSSDNEDSEKAEFEEALSDLEKSIETKMKYINALGKGNGGVWWFYDGNGYTQINIGRGYLDFKVMFDELGECYKIRGSDLKTNFPLRLSFDTTYIYDATQSCYRFVLIDEVENTDDFLEGFVRKLEQDFYADLTEQSDEDMPYAIDSADAFRAMGEGGHYMLTADIELYNWSPISTAIGSLDGNGHIIYLNSFAQSAETTSVNYGLFSTLASDSVLKNLIIDVSHNIYVNLQNASNVTFGYVAGVNNGIIYNCDVVVSKTKSEWLTIYDNTAKKTSNNADEQFGRNIFQNIINSSPEYEGYKTYASTFVMTSKTVSSASVSTKIGGLVGENSSTGTITNCRVGRVDTQTPLGTTDTNVGTKSGPVYAKQGLNLFANGNVGGLVGENSGVISNSYFANGYVVNSLMDIYSSSNTSGARTGGLVAVQNSGGRIFGSYARGQLDDGETRSTLGGVIAYGTIGGLVHSNSGVISNSYSNLNLSSASGMGGFVYENLSRARITHSYSLSKVKTQGLINGMFIGVDNKGVLLDNENSVVENCFYLTEEDAIVDKAERAIPLLQESWQDSTGANFEGFTISTEEDGENTWYMDANRTYLGPQLYLADQVFVSSRDTYGERDQYARGTKINPLLITSLDSFNNRIFHYQDATHKSSYLKVINFDSTKEPNFEYAGAYIMLLVDLDFDSTISTITSKMRFSGHFYGNGHIISGLNFTQALGDTAPNDFGLFAEINNATVSNLSLVLEEELTSRASHVGVLAGTIKDSLIENITLTSSVSKGKVTGTNMVGALAGAVTGDSYVYNIATNLSVSAISATLKNTAYTYYNSKNIYSANTSYAGGIIGVLDLNKSENDDNTTSPRVRNLTIQNVIYTANTAHNSTIELSAEIVGGVVGVIGADSEVYKAYFDIGTATDAVAIRGRNFTGGLVGENRGALLNSRLSLPLAEQIESDSGILATDNVSRYAGNTDLFASENESNAVGGLVGLNIGGIIKYSYNRVAVVNTNAVVAGGLIGLTINAPQSFDTSSTTDPIMAYLQNINLNKANLLTTVTNGEKYTASGGTISSEKGKLSAGALLQEVYTTAYVNGGSVIGGIVGAQINAPIYTYSGAEARIVGANAYNTSDSAFISRISDSYSESDKVQYFGSATGFLGLNYETTPTASNVVAYVSDLTNGTATQKIYVTNTVGSKTISPIGNVSGALGDAVNHTSFILTATDNENKPFENFDSDVWNLDNEKLDFRFPYHKIGYDSPVKDITSVEEFFEYLVKTRASSHYRIIQDLRISGAEWEEFYITSGRNSLGTEQNSVTGKLEGAVAVIENGKYTTRSANITLHTFSESQQKLFRSVFGYTKNFKMSNLNFIFEFDYNVNLISDDCSEFALIVLKSTGSSFNNIGVTLATENEGEITKHTLSYDAKGLGGNIQRLAIFAVNSVNSIFSNVRFDAKLSAKNVIIIGATEFSMGGLVAVASGTLSISGADLGRLNLEYTSEKDYQLHIGGLVGQANVVNLNGSINSTGNICGTIEVSTCGYQQSNIGGVIGTTYSTFNLKNFTANVDVTLNRNNTQQNQGSTDYVGGITATITDSNISGACVLGDISINGGNGAIYVGGVAGEYTNNHNFATSHTGFVTQNCSSYGDITITGTSAYSYIYVGGIYGRTTEQITMSNGLSAPQGDPVAVYTALYSVADINIDATANIIYAGGIIGQARQGIMVTSTEDETSSNYTPFTKLNVILRMASCGFVGDLIVNNELTNGGNSYLGGLIGASELLVQDAYSNGAISYETQGTTPLYLGGVVGLANNHIFGAVSLSIINVSREYGEDDDLTFADPITNVVTVATDSKDRSNQVIVDNVYCSPELNGVYGKYGYAMSALEAFSTATGDLIKANLVNWLYSEVSYDDGETTFAVIIPSAISGMVDYTIGGQIVPVLASDYSQIVDVMADSSYEHSTIFLANDIEVAPGSMGLNLTNVRKIVGNTFSFHLDTYIFSGNLADNEFGLYREIPNNVLISSVGVKFTKISIESNNTANIGVLAGVNYGTIFNVSIGALPSIDTKYMANGSTPQESTVATFSNGVSGESSRYLSSVLDSQEIATLLVKFNATGGSVGGMFGVSKGSITNSFVSVDVSVSGNSSGYLTVGNLVGKSTRAVIDNVMTNGRLNLSVNSAVGGVIGSAYNTIAKGILSNVNMGIFVPNDDKTKAGFAFGEFVGGYYKGVIVNNNISATDTDYFENNKLYSEGGSFATLEMSSNKALLFIAPQDEDGNPIEIDNGFRKEFWIQDVTKYYGYPMLNTITNIDFSTGDGTKENPYQFAETAQLLSLNKATDYYCLTRDMVVSPQNYAEINKISLQTPQLNGMGHTIVIYDLPSIQANEDESGEIWFGLFREIQKDKSVINLGVAFVDSLTISDSARIYFGGLAVRNYGYIANCYVVSNDNDTNYKVGTLTFTNSKVDSYIGGLVSQNYGTITNCWSDVSFVGHQGHFGGLIGLQGREENIENSDGTVIIATQANVANSFSSGSIYLTGSNTTGSKTSAGGLIGMNVSYREACVIKDCYVYGAKLGASHTGLNIGALIGYNYSHNSLGKNVLNTYRTYAFVATDTTPDTSNKPTGNYLDLGLVGNRSEITNNDTSSSFTVVYYRTDDDDEGYYADDTMRQPSTSLADEKGNLVLAGSGVTKGLRGYILGSDIYKDWTNESIWTRHTSATGYMGTMLYLNGVTPDDRTEYSDTGAIPKNDIIFRVK